MLHIDNITEHKIHEWKILRLGDFDIQEKWIKRTQVLTLLNKDSEVKDHRHNVGSSDFYIIYGTWIIRINSNNYEYKAWQRFFIDEKVLHWLSAQTETLFLSTIDLPIEENSPNLIKDFNK